MLIIVIIIMIFINIKAKKILEDFICEKDRKLAEKIYGISVLVIFFLIYEMMLTNFLESIITCIFCYVYVSYKKTKIAKPDVTLLESIAKSLIELVKTTIILVIVFFLVMSCCMFIIY